MTSERGSARGPGGVGDRVNGLGNWQLKMMKEGVGVSRREEMVHLPML